MGAAPGDHTHAPHIQKRDHLPSQALDVPEALESDDLRAAAVRPTASQPIRFGRALAAHLSIPATARQVSAAGAGSCVARALKPDFYAEAGAFHGLRDVRHLQETEAGVCVLAPPLVQVPGFGTDVEGNEHEPAGPQHAADLPEGRGKLARLQAADRVERDDGPGLAIAGRQVKEIPLAELGIRIRPPTRGDHASGQAGADGSPAVAGDPGRDVPRAAAGIRDRRALPGLLDQAGQERPAGRLAGEFAAVGVRVLPGDSVVAAANPVMTS